MQPVDEDRVERTAFGSQTTPHADVERALVLCNPEDFSPEDIASFRDECLSAGEYEVNGGSLLEQMDPEEWLAHVVGNRVAETCQKGWVTEDVFFGVRPGDGRIVGVTVVRHSIDNPILAAYGGHIGYEIRPSERHRGYAIMLLELALEHARRLGMDRVMLGCTQDNAGSIATIEACGGVREMRTPSPLKDGKPAQVYWIELA